MGLKFVAEKKRVYSTMTASFSCILFLGIMLVSFCAQSYVKFNSDPTEGWESVLEQSGVERTYSVERGDTLYGISKTLFGDAEFWPKIWSINSNITNPHIIEKGQVIYFSGGTAIAPPRFGMDSIRSQSYTYGSGLVHPLIPPEPITKDTAKIPEVFQNYFKAGGEKSKEEEMLESISVNKRAAVGEERRVEITSEVVSSKPLSVGKVTRIQSQALSAKVGTLVSVSFKGEGARIAQRFSLFKYTSGGLFSGKKKLKVDMVEWLGSIEILGRASENEYIARVVNCNDLIGVGAEISTEEPMTISLPNKTDRIVGVKENSKVKIMGANNLEDVLIVGESEVVYLRGGARQGVEPGQIYPIFNNFGSSVLGKEGKYVQKSVGYVKIAKVTNRHSTGVVFNLSSEVSSGNRLGVSR